MMGDLRSDFSISNPLLNSILHEFHYAVSRSSDPDKAWHFVTPYLGPE